jgi:hypothetical protein
MKVITINTPQGQYELPLIKVAEDRAEYYGDKDGFDMDSMEWKDEIDWVMKDNYEGIDWLINNSDWEDWEHALVKVNDTVKTADEDFWFDSENFEIN